MKKPAILVVQDYFLPGFMGGGSLRTVANIVQRLGGAFDFSVLTRDRDMTAEHPYPDLLPGWMPGDGCRVRYLPPRAVTPWGVLRAARSVPYDLIYFNSFFSTLTVFLLVLRRLGLLPRKPALLAPRGEFAAEALALKARKKALYFGLARRLGLLRGVRWHASSPQEASEIGRLFEGEVGVAMDVCDPSSELCLSDDPPVKESGSVRFVFLSRLDRKKNLSTALQWVGMLTGDVTFDIYGTIEDPHYWEECREAIARMPSNIHCRYRGSVPHHTVPAVLSQYHFFLFPTRNENFGHVILEALAVSVPVVISDATPWRGLPEQQAGFDLPLDDPDGFRTTLQACVAMGPREHRRLSRGALELARAFLADDEPLEATRRIFLEALESKRS